MKASCLTGLCAALFLGAAETGAADMKDASAGEQVDEAHDTPETIACAQERGEALGQCTYSINRDEKGTTTIRVIFANGFKRSLFFEDGKFLKASVTMSGTGTDIDWSLEAGMHMIRVDGQRYEVPDSLIAR